MGRTGNRWFSKVVKDMLEKRELAGYQKEKL